MVLSVSNWEPSAEGGQTEVDAAIRGRIRLAVKARRGAGSTVNPIFSEHMR